LKPRNEIRQRAQLFFTSLILQNDPMLKNWRKAKLGVPFLVKNLCLGPAFWFIPVNLKKRVLGYLTVNLEGELMGHTYFHTSPDDIDDLPVVVTRIRSGDALLQAKSIIEQYQNVNIREPVFVYDEFRGWFAWLITIERGGVKISNVFVTPGYCYERKPGDRLRVDRCGAP